MDRLYLARFAHLDSYISPMCWISYAVLQCVHIFIILPEGFKYFHSQRNLLISIMTAAGIIIWIVNSIYLLKTKNCKKHLILRLPLNLFMLFCFCWQNITLPLIGLKFAAGSIGYFITALGVICIMEKLEVDNYEHIKLHKMDMVYRKNWKFLGFPIYILLYGQLLMSARFIIYYTATPSDPNIYGHGLIIFELFFHLVRWGNVGLFFFGVVKKSRPPLMIYFYIKIILYIIGAALYNIRKVQENHWDENGSAYLSMVIVPLIVFFELAQVLRFYCLLTLEAEMPVGEYSFLIKKSFTGDNLLDCDFDNSVKRFLNSIRVSSRRVAFDPELLGEGHSAKVFKGWIKSIPSFKRTPVAIKILKNVEVEDFESIITELKILSMISNLNEHLVGFFGCSNLSENHLGIILEYIGGGNLLQRLEKIRESDNWDVQNIFTSWSIEIADGMEFLSAKKIIHGDLAARNILLTNELKCKISDFGMAIRLSQYRNYATSTQTIMPFRWMAPESLSDLKFSAKSDVWSYAVLLWEIYSLGRLPWSEIPEWNSDFVTNLKNGAKLQKPLLATNLLYVELLLKCWELDPEDRPNFNEMNWFIKKLSEASCISNKDVLKI